MIAPDDVTAGAAVAASGETEQARRTGRRACRDFPFMFDDDAPDTDSY